MELLITGVVSLLSGVAASMGLGGGFILLVYLTVFGDMPQMEAQWINLIFFLPIGGLALFFHIKNRLIDKKGGPSCCTGRVGGSRWRGGIGALSRK